jgi:hypothetical protein
MCSIFNSYLIYPISYFCGKRLRYCEETENFNGCTMSEERLRKMPILHMNSNKRTVDFSAIIIESAKRKSPKAFLRQFKCHCIFIFVHMVHANVKVYFKHM